MRLAGLLLFGASAWAQISGPAIAPSVGQLSPGGAASSAPSPPGVWIGAGLFQGQHHLEPMLLAAASLGKATYSFSTVEFQGVRKHPFAVLTSVETGVAQRLTTVSQVDVYAILGAGAAATGSTAGGSFAGGFLATAPVGKGWTAGLFARVQQTTGTLATSSVTLGVVVGMGR